MSKSILFDPANFRREVERMKASGLITIANPSAVAPEKQKDTRDRNRKLETEKRLARAKMSDEQFESWIRTQKNRYNFHTRVRKSRENDIKLLRTAARICACGCGKDLKFDNRRPRKFLPGHNLRTLKRVPKKSVEFLKLISNGARIRELSERTGRTVAALTTIASRLKKVGLVKNVGGGVWVKTEKSV